MAQEFYEKWNFPLCIGTLDGKLIRCHCTANSGSIYFKFHGWYSIVVMAVRSAHYLYLMVNIGSVGSASDGGIFERSGMKMPDLSKIQQCAVFDTTEHTTMCCVCQRSASYQTQISNVPM